MKKLVIATAIAILAATGAQAAPAAKAPSVPELAAETVSQRGPGGYYHGKKWHQGHGPVRHEFLTPWEVSRSLHRKGFRKVHDIRFTRGVYVAKAIGHRGLVRLVVDARDGDILRRDVIAYHRYGGRGTVYHGGNGNFSITLGIR